MDNARAQDLPPAPHRKRKAMTTDANQLRVKRQVEGKPR